MEPRYQVGCFCIQCYEKPERKNTDKSVSEHLPSTYFARRSQKNKPNEKEKHKGVDSFHRKISNNSPLTGIITNFLQYEQSLSGNVRRASEKKKQWKENWWLRAARNSGGEAREK